MYICASVTPNPTAGGWKAERGFYITAGETTGGRKGVWFSVCTVYMSECVCSGLRVCVCMTGLVGKRVQKCVLTIAYMCTRFTHQYPL